MDIYNKLFPYGNRKTIGRIDNQEKQIQNLN